MTGVSNTGGKFMTGVNDTHYIFLTGVNDIGHKSLNTNIYDKIQTNSKWLLPITQGSG